MQHKELIHAREILLPILEMPLIQNITPYLLMLVFVGSPLKFPQAFHINSNKNCQIRPLFKVCGKANLKGT